MINELITEMKLLVPSSRQLRKAMARCDDAFWGQAMHAVYRSNFVATWASSVAPSGDRRIIDDVECSPVISPCAFAIKSTCSA